METPLIWTTKGNIPVESLEYKYFWLEDEESIKFVEEYYLDGEKVKSSSHLRLKNGVDVFSQAGTF